MSKCDNCGSLWREEQLKDVVRYFERVEPGGVVPSGECPDCGALCYLEEGKRWTYLLIHKHPYGQNIRVFTSELVYEEMAALDVAAELDVDFEDNGAEELELLPVEVVDL